MSGERRIQGFERVWIDLVYCRGCQDFYWHLEIAEETERDGYVPRCPECGSHCDVLHDSEGQRVQR